jgi:hypothetical protein
MPEARINRAANAAAKPLHALNRRRALQKGASRRHLRPACHLAPSDTASTRPSSRVEDGRGGLGHPASPRFPSPLIERSMRISRTTLSDWLHRNAHDEAHDRSRLSGGHRLRIAAELLPTSPGTSGVCRLSPITMPSPSSEAHQKSGSFPPPALPGLSSNMTLSESR